jgi:hypothetical protein
MLRYRTTDEEGSSVKQQASLRIRQKSQNQNCEYVEVKHEKCTVITDNFLVT